MTKVLTLVFFFCVLCLSAQDSLRIQDRSVRLAPGGQHGIKLQIRLSDSLQNLNAKLQDTVLNGKSYSLVAFDEASGGFAGALRLETGCLYALAAGDSTESVLADFRQTTNNTTDSTNPPERLPHRNVDFSAPKQHLIYLFFLLAQQSR